MLQIARGLLRLAPLAGRGRIASAIRVRGSLREGSGNRFKDARQIAQHFIIPKSKHSIIVIDEPFVANCVARIVRMLPSINLDDKATFPADKVHCVGTDRLLSDELMSVQPPGAQPKPKTIFRVRGSLPQTPGPSCLFLISRTHVEAPPHPDCFAIRPLPASGERLARNTTP